MTLKVVKVNGESKAVAGVTRQNDSKGQAGQTQSVQPSSATGVVSSYLQSEAAVVHNTRAAARSTTTTSAEKVKEYKEAKELADDVAGRIKFANSDDAHHEISPVAAKEHLLA